MTEPAPGQAVGRYVLYDEIASGGMASVHMGRLIGPVGFSRVVAVKRSHAAYAKDPSFVAMMLDEARLASRVRHPNVIPILDVVTTESELLLVMEYVPGETLARLLRAARRAGETVPAEIVTAVVIDALRGLGAAHDATDTSGAPLGIVHRDVSPQNVLVSTDGAARLFDFGVAKAASRSQSTNDGQLKGKLGYVAPEQISGKDVDRRVDLFAASIVAWEALAGRRLFAADDMVATLARVADAEIPPLRDAGVDVPEALERAIRRGLERDPAERFQSAEEMARELEAAVRPASREQVAAWVERLASDALARRLEVMRRIESGEVDSGVVQVPVGISPDQTGKVSTLRTSLRDSAGGGEDPGTSSALATQSILPQARRDKGWQRGALMMLAAAALGAIVTAALVSRRDAPRAVERPTSATLGGGAATSSVPTVSAAPSSVAEAAAPDAADVPVPAPSASAKPARPTKGVPFPAVDPLMDQR